MHLFIFTTFMCVCVCMFLNVCIISFSFKFCFQSTKDSQKFYSYLCIWDIFQMPAKQRFKMPETYNNIPIEWRPRCFKFCLNTFLSFWSWKHYIAHKIKSMICLNNKLMLCDLISHLLFCINFLWWFGLRRK